MSSTYILEGFSFDLNQSNSALSNTAASTLELVGGSALELVILPVEGSASFSLSRTFDWLDSATLNGAPLDLESLDDLVSLFTYERNDVMSQTILVFDLTIDAVNGLRPGFAFTLSGLGLTDAAVPTAEALEQAFDELEFLSFGQGDIPPGTPFAVRDLQNAGVMDVVPDLTQTGTGADDKMIGADGSTDFFRGGSGDDSLSGRDGNDTLNGEAGDDVLAGSTGNDVISGGADNDNIGGGQGTDRILGDGGDDTIGAGQGDDTADGGAGNDIVNGGAGNDILSGDVGNDTMGAGFDNDSVAGNAGNDSLGGGTGQDTLIGGDGADAIGGGEGDDSITGNAGNDTVNGGGRNDTISGGDGNDQVNGGIGDDDLSGGVGADLFVFNTLIDGELDIISDFAAGEDRLRLSGVEGEDKQGRFDALQIAGLEGTGTAIIYEGHQIVLLGVNPASLSLDDFVFV